MSVDPDCSPEITAMIGVSAAIAISDIPWDGPISGVNVGLVDGQIVINPGLEDRAKSDLVLTVASTADLIAMIEAGGNEISDEQMFDAIMAGHEENKKIVKFIQGIVDEIGKPKFAYESSDPDPEILAQIEDFCIEDVKKALDTDDKMFVMRLFFLFMTQFTRSLTSSLRATRARLTRLCILFKSMLFVLGSRMSIRELTAEVLTRFVLLMPKSTFFQEFTVQVCSQEVKHRYFQLQHSVL